jgi:hypothetical protein
VFLMSIGDLADKVDKAAHARVANAAEDDDATVAMLGKLAKTRTNTTDNDVNVESEENSFWNDVKHHDFYFAICGETRLPLRRTTNSRALTSEAECGQGAELA